MADFSLRFVVAATLSAVSENVEKGEEELGSSLTVMINSHQVCSQKQHGTSRSAAARSTAAEPELPRRNGLPAFFYQLAIEVLEHKKRLLPFPAV